MKLQHRILSILASSASSSPRSRVCMMLTFELIHAWLTDIWMKSSPKLLVMYSEMHKGQHVFITYYLRQSLNHLWRKEISIPDLVLKAATINSQLFQQFPTCLEYISWNKKTDLHATFPILSSIYDPSPPLRHMEYRQWPQLKYIW